jgi:hypothetical protein
MQSRQPELGSTPRKWLRATAAARSKSLDELIDELIILPANAAAEAYGLNTRPPDDR